MMVEKGDDEIIPDAEMSLRKVQSFLIFELEHLSIRPEGHCPQQTSYQSILA